MVSEKLWYHSQALPSCMEMAHLGRHLEWAYNSSGLVWAFIRNSSIGSIYITVVECENKHSCGIALNISIQQGVKRELYRWTTDKRNSSSSGQFNWGTKQELEKTGLLKIAPISQPDFIAPSLPPSLLLPQFQKCRNHQLSKKLSRFFFTPRRKWKALSLFTACRPTVSQHASGCFIYASHFRRLPFFFGL